MNRFKRLPLTSSIQEFTKDSEHPSYWNPTGNIVPIYIANQLKSVEHKSATVMWPGSNVVYDKRTVSHAHKFDKSMKSKERLKLGKDLFFSNKYNHVMIYLDEVDETEHKFGTLIRNIYSKIQEVDTYLNAFYKAVRERSPDVNFIIVGDHGFSQIDPAKIIKPADLFSGINARIEFNGAVVGLIPGQENVAGSVKDVDEIVTKLEKIAADRYEVFKKENIPDEYRLRRNVNIPPIVLIAKDGYYIDVKGESPVADHGWFAGTNTDMKTIFIGEGPKFAREKLIATMSITDIYRISCNILDLTHECHSSESEFDVDEVISSK